MKKNSNHELDFEGIANEPILTQQWRAAARNTVYGVPFLDQQRQVLPVSCTDYDDLSRGGNNPVGSWGGAFGPVKPLSKQVKPIQVGQRPSES